MNSIFRSVSLISPKSKHICGNLGPKAEAYPDEN